jgi:hypothetical protein
VATVQALALQIASGSKRHLAVRVLDAPIAPHPPHLESQKTISMSGSSSTDVLRSKSRSRCPGDEVVSRNACPANPCIGLGDRCPLVALNVSVSTARFWQLCEALQKTFARREFFSL